MNRPAVITDAMLGALAHNAKLNKPSPHWKTAEWDRAVDLVVEAMTKPPPEIPGNAA